MIYCYFTVHSIYLFLFPHYKRSLFFRFLCTLLKICSFYYMYFSYVRYKQSLFFLILYDLLLLYRSFNIFEFIGFRLSILYTDNLNLVAQKRSDALP